MQLDMFGIEEPEEALPALTLLEHSSSEYKPRTLENARADVTVAFAVDFETAGERLTRKAAGPRYTHASFGSDIADAAATLASFMGPRQAKTLNVAGNGIYTLDQHKVSQLCANQWVYDVLKLVLQRVRLTSIRSGGQTGVDMAGLVAALALDVPAIGLYPKGYRMRGADKREIYSDPGTIEKRLRAYAQKLSL
jgi:hypothetical protein